jgi:hypothetical protein
MSRFVVRNQCVIESKKAKAVGKPGLREKTDELLKDFFNDICKTVLNSDDDVFVVQWAIVQLDKEDRDAIIEG